MRLLCTILAIFFCLLHISAEAVLKDWTIITYINADNNLNDFGLKDQQEMTKVGSNEWLNIITILDLENKPATINFIERGTAVLLQQLGEVDMGDYIFFAHTINQIVGDYPAKHYAIIIWNHGSGWKNNTATKGISYDDSSGNHITTQQLGMGLKMIRNKLGQNIDILGMDACLMQTIEVAYEIAPSVDIIIASQDLEPGDGYPYNLILESLTPNMSPEKFGCLWVKSYASSYNNGSQGMEATTQSALRSIALPALIDAISGFAKAIMATSDIVATKQALQQVQTFHNKSNIDLLHFTDLLSKTQDTALQTAISKLQLACRQAVLINQTTGTQNKHASGLSIYFPQSLSELQSYQQLTFAQHSMWDDMLKHWYRDDIVKLITLDLQNNTNSFLNRYMHDINPEFANYIISRIKFATFTERTLSAQQLKLLTELLSHTTK